MTFAQVFSRQGKVILESQSKTVAGYYIGSEPVLVVDPADAQGLVAGLRRVLAAYSTGVQTPLRNEQLGKELYSAAGVADWREFIKGTKCIYADRDNGTVILTPMRNDGRGFTDLPNARKRTVSLASPDLASSVLDALSDAE